ncbi:hypothetical protein ACBQ24_09485 [Acinetobacter terrestris]|uniref:hypothetical protein n=1 Tax=Acinetobacter terrestris TaxID=2529843 RepID=UPI003523630B
MKKILLSLIGACLVTSAFAYVEPLRKAKCLYVVNNKPQNIQACHINAGGGAGGIERAFSINQNEFVLEWFDAGLASEVYRISKNNGKAMNATNYYRSRKTLATIKNPELGDWECIKDNKNITHFCYK